jgi:hypothetical protein
MMEVILSRSAPNGWLESFALERTLGKIRRVGVCIGAHLDSIDIASGRGSHNESGISLLL